MHGGWCVNPVNLLSQPEQMRYVLDHSDCSWCSSRPSGKPAVRALLAGLERPVALIVADPDGCRACRASRCAHDADGHPAAAPRPTRWRC